MRLPSYRALLCINFIPTFFLVIWISKDGNSVNTNGKICAYEHPGIIYHPAEADSCLEIDSPEVAIRGTLQNHFTSFCEARLLSFRRYGIPKLVTYPILSEEYRKSYFAVERAWRAAFTQHKYIRTAMQTEATFIISKQPRYDMLSYGKMCPETQMFNHIPRQEFFADKVAVVRMLRSVSLGGLKFEDIMLPTFVFDGPAKNGTSSASDQSEWEGFKKTVPLINNAVDKDSDDDIMWIHKKRGVENSEGITLISAKNAQLLADGKKVPGNNIKSPLSMSGVLQHYLRNPFLINGKKTEFRVFLLIASVKPLAAFTFKDFYVRISPEVYKKDASGHAAFTSVESLLHQSDGAKGSNLTKDEILAQGYMSPTQFGAYMHNSGHTNGLNGETWLNEVFYVKLKLLLALVLRAGLSNLSDLPGYFSLFGLDLLMDENNKLHFSEMNYSPGIAWTDVGEYRKEMSTRLVHEIIGIQTGVIRYRMHCAGKSTKSRISIGCDKSIMDEVRGSLVSGQALAYDNSDGSRWWYQKKNSTKIVESESENSHNINEEM